MALRIGIVAILYGFLVTIVILIQRELGAETAARRAARPVAGSIILIREPRRAPRGRPFPSSP